MVGKLIGSGSDGKSMGIPDHLFLKEIRDGSLDLFLFEFDELTSRMKAPGFDGLIFMAGEWTVTKVTSTYALAEAGAGVSGTPALGYVAVIQSANAQSR